jgi:hypothetical protein
MNRVEEARREVELRLEQARREAELRLAEVRATVESEIGHSVKKRYLLLLLAAGAGGFALAMRRPGRRKRLKAARKALAR